MTNFSKNSTINPRTRRSIKQGGPVYNVLVKGYGSPRSYYPSSQSFPSPHYNTSKQQINVPTANKTGIKISLVLPYVPMVSPNVQNTNVQELHPYVCYLILFLLLLPDITVVKY